jgi:hypothetical protein
MSVANNSVCVYNILLKGLQGARETFTELRKLSRSTVYAVKHISKLQLPINSNIYIYMLQVDKIITIFQSAGARTRAV